jgi:hypothetical protein
MLLHIIPCKSFSNHLYNAWGCPKNVEASSLHAKPKYTKKEDGDGVKTERYGGSADAAEGIEVLFGGRSRFQLELLASRLRSCKPRTERSREAILSLLMLFCRIRLKLPSSIAEVSCESDDESASKSKSCVSLHLR